ncbi:MAG: hypothetical protein KIT09_36030 [Bryobacteraceae bacterium]|nr:hypothetical protein [Bryobacteraceae bacterium]
MHFEVLIEDRSGEVLLDSLMSKIFGTNGYPHSWRTHAYRGIGRVPRDLRGKTDPQKRILLDRLPRILAGYGRSLQGQDSAVVIVVDVDARDCIELKKELLQVLRACNPGPRTLFRFAVEETEAWLLGDRRALLKAFPKARLNVLDAYVQDSICGTWEVLADSVFPGGSAALRSAGYPKIGEEKHRWACLIGPHLDIDGNLSHSLKIFRNGILDLSGTTK